MTRSPLTDRRGEIRKKQMRAEVRTAEVYAGLSVPCNVRSAALRKRAEMMTWQVLENDDAQFSAAHSRYERYERYESRRYENNNKKKV